MRPELRCVLVDDDPDWLELIHYCLTRVGWQVHATKFIDPLAALAFLRHQHVDLVISDTRMTGIDGFAVVQEMHRIDPTTPVVLISSDESVAGAALAAGARAFVRKGALNTQLARAVDEIFASATLSRAPNTTR